MKKISTIAAAAALALTAAAPVAAETKADPFVSTNGGLENSSIAIISLVTLGIVVAASDGS